MELMDMSLDKFYRKVLDKGLTIPEDILGEIAVSVSGVEGVPMVVSWAELGPPCGLQLWSCSWAAALGASLKGTSNQHGSRSGVSEFLYT